MIAPQQTFRCPDCRRVLLVVMDASDPGLAEEMAVKVDGHVCAMAEPTTEVG